MCGSPIINFGKISFTTVDFKVSFTPSKEIGISAVPVGESLELFAHRNDDRLGYSFISEFFFWISRKRLSSNMLRVAQVSMRHLTGLPCILQRTRGLFSIPTACVFEITVGAY